MSYRSVLLRDLGIFYVKVAIDGLKGMLLIQVALIAAGLDVIRPGRVPGHRFYAVLRMAEKFDLWLNLYGAAAHAERDTDGLFGRSRAGSDSLLGKLEEIVRGEGYDANHATNATR